MLVAIAALLAVAAPAVATDRPIIGILTKPTPTALASYGSSWLSGDYVHWIEGGGARPAVIPYDASTATLDELFDGLNGMLFTGGDLSLDANTTYYKTASYLFHKAIAANNAGDHFPVWGTCMGFQLLSILVADDHSVLQNGFDSLNESLPLNFTSTAANSKLFASSALRQLFSDNAITMNLHVQGVPPQTYASNAKLAAFFNLISTNVDRKGRAFGSTIEGLKHPVFGTQWHPERPQYVWDKQEALNHSPLAVGGMQAMAQFFVGEARQSEHAFANATTEATALIYNWQPTDTRKAPEGFPEPDAYFWPQK